MDDVVDGIDQCDCNEQCDSMVNRRDEMANGRADSGVVSMKRQLVGLASAGRLVNEQATQAGETVEDGWAEWWKSVLSSQDRWTQWLRANEGQRWEGVESRR